ncbi:MAG: 16S rRNA (guanine(966)-N(2))-methyltransferase RsmD [Pseudomonadales bacterium]
MPKTSKPHTRNQPTVRIIGGKLRGRKLQFPSAEGLRPTLGRTRETLFNWLTTEIPGARCLDLFAGSGALGFEALSRGAESVVFVEREPLACRFLEENIARLELTDIQAQVIPKDSIRFLEQLDQHTRPFDLIFLDPPFGSSLLQDSLNRVALSPHLSPHLSKEGLIYYECAASTQLQHQPLRSLRHKRAGDYQYGLLSLP